MTAEMSHSRPQRQMAHFDRLVAATDELEQVLTTPGHDLEQLAAHTAVVNGWAAVVGAEAGRRGGRR